METSIVNLLGALAISVVTAVVAVHLALRRFRAEQWWERKARVYSSILESLHVLRRGLEDDLEEMERMGRGIEGANDDVARESRQQWKKAMNEVLKAVDTGAFLLSQETNDVLRAWKGEWDRAEKNNVVEGHFLHYDAMSDQIKALDRCLMQLPPLARKDLNIS